jgi:hypothetical protein
MTKLEIKKLVAVLVASYPASKITDESVGVYERMLADLDYPAANAAVERLLATSKWLPTVAEIRESTLALTVGEIRAGGEAWGDVLRAMRRYGYVRTPGKEFDFDFDDPAVAETVKSMNWTELCSSGNVVADRARFIELYDQLAARSRRLQLSEGLPAMQRFRAIQAAQRKELEPGQAQSIGKLIRLVLPGGDE